MYITSAYLYKSVINATRIGRSIFQYHSYQKTHSKIKQISDQSINFHSLEVVLGELNNFFNKNLGVNHDTTRAFWKRRKSHFC